MRITCVSDLHGSYPYLRGGDLLIIGGDLTRSDKAKEYLEFSEWVRGQDYKYKVFVCGNHDGLIERGDFYFNPQWLGIEWLNDSGCEIEGFKLWGSPWTKSFPNMNPHCKAYTVDSDRKLAEKWENIPKDIDILITHTPAYLIHDTVERMAKNRPFKTQVGSVSLRNVIDEHKTLKLHVCGHIHEGYGILHLKGKEFDTICVNASHMDKSYNPINSPIEIDL